MLNRLLLPFSLSILCSCAPPGTGPVHGISERSASFIHVGDDSVPGLDRGSVLAVTMQAGPPAGVPFVVWSDASNVSGHGEGSSHGASYVAELHTDEGSTIDVHAATNDGVSGTVTINKTAYNLRDGALFLVSTQGSATAVKQMDLDVTDFPIEQEELRRIVNEHPEIADFFKPAAEGSQANSDQNPDR